MDLNRIEGEYWLKEAIFLLIQYSPIDFDTMNY